MERYSIEGKLVIFPSYTYYLQRQGYRIQHKQDKLSNRKLNEILMKCNIAEALNKEYQPPDIMIYDKGEWKEIRTESGAHLDAGVYGKYTYYSALVQQGVNIALSNAVEAFLQQYSSAKIRISK